MVEVDRGQPESGRRPLQPLQVPVEGERPVLHHLHRLEDAVADGEAVVGEGHGGRRRVGQQVSVDPGAHAVSLGPTAAR
ncbi:hypothetical protein [Nocardioides sambongensis]|uniref:hypothetical protein n=1 Tax=Nocardioides sambongensis TaxID=2589074 RepID=UPI001E548140